MTRAPVRILLGMMLAGLGLACPLITVERSVPVPVAAMLRDSGYSYRVPSLPAAAAEIPSDSVRHPTGSPAQLLEDGKPLGPAHSQHSAIREHGRGRFSHWNGGLWLSASDDTDPRTNGRTYVIVDRTPLPKAIAWSLLIAAALVFTWTGLDASRGALVPWLRSRGPEWTAEAQRHWVHAGIFAVLATCALWLGAERSGWVLATQPLDLEHTGNSLLGSSSLYDGVVLHRNNASSFLQAAFFAGADVTPDAYFWRPVHGFIVSLGAPLGDVVSSMLAINLLAWMACVWLTHRFTRSFYDDEQAARWAAPLAAAGIGFVVHLLDLSGHLLSLAFYAAGVVIVFESQAWRRQVGFRVHLALGAFLALACLQSGNGFILVAGYLLVSVRHNRLRHVLPVCAGALAAQALWGAILGEIVMQRRGVGLGALSGIDAVHLERAITGWRNLLASSPGHVLSALGESLLSLTTVEMPVVVMLGAIGLWRVRRNRPDRRAHLAFAIPFVLLPLAAAVFLAPAVPERGPVAYGMTLFLFAGTGAMLANLVRRREGAFAPIAALLVVASLGWSTAHFGGVLGPAKAYVSGIQQARHLFIPGGWEAESLTNSDPTPRLFGGSATLAQSGLASWPTAQVPEPAKRHAGFAALAGAVFCALVALLLVPMVPWPSAVCAGLLLAVVSALAGQVPSTSPSVALVEYVHRIETGQSLSYKVELGTNVRKRLAAGLRQGGVVTLFPAYYTGQTALDVQLGGVSVTVQGRIDFGNVVLDPKSLLEALGEGRPGVLTVTFSGGDGVWTGGWQSRGLPGRRLMAGSTEHPSSVLPAIELRLLRDLESRTPLFIAF